MTEHRENCRTCRCIGSYSDSKRICVCRRYPTPLDKRYSDWCGEWKPRVQQVEDEPRTMTHEEQFLAQICQMIDAYDTIPTADARVIAQDMAERILRLFDPTFRPSGPVYPYYRIQVADGTVAADSTGWHTLRPPLDDLR